MPRITGEFFLFVQDRQEFGSNGQMMISRAYFRMSVGGRPPGEYYATVKLAVGGDYLDAHQIEVSAPSGYPGQFNQEAFSTAVSQYVRSCVGPGAQGIDVDGLSPDLYIGNMVRKPMPFAFDAPEGPVSSTW